MQFYYKHWILYIRNAKIALFSKPKVKDFDLCFIQMLRHIGWCSIWSWAVIFFFLDWLRPPVFDKCLHFLQNFSPNVFNVLTISYKELPQEWQDGQVVHRAPWARESCIKSLIMIIKMTQLNVENCTPTKTIIQLEFQLVHIILVTLYCNKVYCSRLTSSYWLT